MTAAAAQSPTWKTRLRRSAVAQFFIALACIGIPFLLSNIAVRSFPKGDEAAFLRNAFKAGVLIASYLAYVRWAEKRKAFELSLRGGLQEIGLGVLLGGALIIASVLLLVLFGSYEVNGINSAVPWFRYIAGFLAVATMEELIFRVVLFRILEQSMGSLIAIALSAICFGAAHAFNPHATIVSTASLSVISLMFVASFMLTRRLWFCMGLHWGWNLIQALGSLPVSGTETRGVLDGHLTGTAWMTGSDFGVEASLPTLLLALMTTGFLLHVSRKKGHFTKPFWNSTDKRTELSRRE